MTDLLYITGFCLYRNFNDLTEEEYAMFNNIEKNIRTNAIYATSVEESIDEITKDEELTSSSVGEALRIILSEAKEDNSIDEDIHIVRMHERSVEMIDMCKNCNKCNAIIPQNVSIHSITRLQKNYLSGLGIEYIKWCIEKDGKLLAKNTNYIKVDSLIVSDHQGEEVGAKEGILLLGALGILLFLSVAGKFK